MSKRSRFFVANDVTTAATSARQLPGAGYDCGVFVISYAEALSRHLCLHLPLPAEAIGADAVRDAIETVVAGHVSRGSVHARRGDVCGIIYSLAGQQAQ
jgi:hypothetical protein